MASSLGGCRETFATGLVACRVGSGRCCGSDSRVGRSRLVGVIVVHIAQDNRPPSPPGEQPLTERPARFEAGAGLHCPRSRRFWRNLECHGVSVVVAELQWKRYTICDTS